MLIPFDLLGDGVTHS